MKRAIVTVATTGLTVLCSFANIADQPKNKRAVQGAETGWQRQVYLDLWEETKTYYAE